MPTNSQASTSLTWLRGVVALLGLIALALLAVLATAPASHGQTPGYTEVSAGFRNTCALKADGIDCWGSNLSGESKDQVGLFLQVTADTEHSCAIQSGSHSPTNVLCWGYNDEGQISPPGIEFGQISAGQDYTCGVTANGYADIVCWGSNYYGQSKYQPGPYKQVSASTYHACGLKVDGSVHCWGADFYGERTDPPGRYTDVSAGEYHTCAIREDTGAVECWGAGTKDTGFYPNYGQAMPPAGKFLQVSAGALFTCGVKADHTLACWGYNFYGQVKRAPEGEFKQVSAGLGGHACAISINDEVYCWGKNDAWQARVPNVGGPIDTPAYNFQGFFAPVQADPVLNVVKAGSSVPLKFSLGGDEGLGGDQGLKVLAPDWPASGTLDCKTMEPADDLQPAASAGKSGLTYDPASDTYTYAWKTEKAWAGSCRYLSLQLTDGTEHRVAFQFK